MSVVLEATNIYQEFEGEELFEPFSFSVKDHDRIALLGQNGSGKTTIFKILLNQLKCTKGNVIIPKNVKVGYLSQDVIEDENNTLYQEILSIYKKNIDLEKRVNQISAKLADSPSDDLLRQYQSALDEFEACGGYSYLYKVDMILMMFAFSKEDYQRKISSFSGGEKSKISFSKLLLDNPDILILDEPTNHLSILSIEWLENYLSTYKGAVIFSSHDLTFIKSVANRIMDIDNKVVTTYNMDYDNFARTKKMNYENMLLQYRMQEEQKEKLKRFITFYMPKPRFASRAKDRVKKLERLEKNSISDPDSVKKRKLSFSLSGDTREGKKLLQFNSVSIGYDKPLIEDISFTLFGKERLAVMGDNGVGKTTLSKVLLGQLKPLSGEIRKYFDISIGILRQDISSYKEDITLFDHVRNLYPLDTNEEIFSLFARYSFSHDEVFKKSLINLSGGEIMRLELMLLSKENYDLLILDEPTNHLDMMSISELIDCISCYSGTMIIISHNRDFVDKTCSSILFLLDKKSYYFKGGYKEFKEEELKKIFEKKKESLLQGEKEKTEIKEYKVEKRVKINVDNLLLKIDKLESEKKKLEAECEKEENYKDNKKMSEIEEKMKKIDDDLLILYQKLESSM